MDLKDYAEHPSLHALAEVAIMIVPPYLAPAVPALQAALVQRAQKLAQDKLVTLLETLREGEQELTPEVIESAPVLNAFLATAEAAVRSEARGKVRYFGRLLLSGIGEHAKYDLRAEHEGYLNLLLDLTYREIGILATLHEFERGDEGLSIAEGGQLQQPYWDKFLDTVSVRFAIRRDEVDWVLARLARTGLYTTAVGGVRLHPAEPTGESGRLTPLYFRLADLIHHGTWKGKPEDFLSR